MSDFAAGESVTAARMVSRTKDELIGQYRTTNSAATSGTTELVYATQPAVNLDASTLYRVRANCYFTNSVNLDQFAIRIRATNVSGTILNGVVQQGLAGGPYSVQCTAYYLTTAAESGVVFVATIVRVVGTGTATPQVQSDVEIERVADSGVFTTV